MWRFQANKIDRWNKCAESCFSVGVGRNLPPENPLGKSCLAGSEFLMPLMTKKLSEIVC